MSKKIKLLSVGLVVFVGVLMVFAGPALASYSLTSHTVDHSAVAGGKHDIYKAIAGENPCDACHIPHGVASGATYLFALSPNTGADSKLTNTAVEDAGVTSAIMSLCYSCHQGTGPGSKVGAEVFSVALTNHRTHSAAQINPSSKTGAAYGPGRDCDLCHDPHDDGNASFLKYERYSTHGGAFPAAGTTAGSAGWYLIQSGGNVCASCHGGNMNVAGGSETNHPTEVVPGALAATQATAGNIAVTASRTPISAEFNPPTSLGTRLFDFTSHLQSPASDAVVECESCHSPHGAVPDAQYVATKATATTPAVYNHGLNTMHLNPGTAAGGNWLCQNCHS